MSKPHGPWSDAPWAKARRFFRKFRIDVELCHSPMTLDAIALTHAPLLYGFCSRRRRHHRRLPRLVQIIVFVQQSRNDSEPIRMSQRPWMQEPTHPWLGSPLSSFHMFLAFCLDNCQFWKCDERIVSIAEHAWRVDRSC